MKYIYSVILFVSMLSAYGQLSTEAWHEGFIVSVDQDTLVGKVNYDMETNMLQFANASSIRAFSSYKVFYFEIFDNIYRSYRQFYTIPYKLRGNYETPVIFELLYEGGLSLLAREKIVQETATSTNPFWSGGAGVIQNRINYDFYFLKKNGDMIYFDGSRKDLYRIMSNKRDKIKDFMRSNRLQTNEMKDLIRITSFYNSI